MIATVFYAIAGALAIVDYFRPGLLPLAVASLAAGLFCD